jgi:hypothetical protein
VPNRQCSAGHTAGECRDTLLSLLPNTKGRNGNRLCPAHDDTDPSLSVNPGTKGMWLVWCCGAGCSPEDVRTAFIRIGADERCLGKYGMPKRAVAPGMPYRSADTATVAAAKRWHAARKLPPELNGRLLLMCMQALEEGDGDLPGDPYRLLPVNSDDFYALARRAGVGHYRYQMYEKWLKEGR